MYTILLNASAEKDLRKLSRPILERINRKILGLRENPRPVGVRKLSGTIDGWRIRVGEYRIVYQISDASQIVTVIRVRHRRDVYRDIL